MTVPQPSGSARPRLSYALPLIAVLLIGTSGCGGGDTKDHPTTYPVTGTVIGADGKPLAGGTIELRATEGPPLSAVGVIQPDGTFELTTLWRSQKLPGAIADSHQVTVMPPAANSQDIQSAAQPISLPAPVDVLAQDENRLTVILPGRMER